MVNPPPRGSPEAGFTGNDIDYSLSSPIDLNQYPCKHTRISPKKMNLVAGSTITAQLGGSAPHGGGVCQFALSYDNVKWISIKDIEGPCMIDSLTYPVTIPSNIPNGNAVFMWTWLNRLGNREYYTNCADVVISGSTGNSFIGPQLLVANIRGTVIPEGGAFDSVALPLMRGRPLISFTGVAPTPTTTTVRVTTTTVRVTTTIVPVGTPNPAPTSTATPTATPLVTPTPLATSTPLTTTAAPLVTPTPLATSTSATSTAISTPTPLPIGCTHGTISCITATQFGTCVWGTLVSQPMAPGTECVPNGSSISIVHAGEVPANLPIPDVESPGSLPVACTVGAVVCLDNGQIQSCLNGTPFTSDIPYGSECTQSGNSAVVSME